MCYLNIIHDWHVGLLVFHYLLPDACAWTHRAKKLHVLMGPGVTQGWAEFGEDHV